MYENEWPDMEMKGEMYSTAPWCLHSAAAEFYVGNNKYGNCLVIPLLSFLTLLTGWFDICTLRRYLKSINSIYSYKTMAIFEFQSKVKSIKYIASISSLCRST